MFRTRAVSHRLDASQHTMLTHLVFDAFDQFRFRSAIAFKTRVRVLGKTCLLFGILDRCIFRTSRLVSISGIVRGVLIDAFSVAVSDERCIPAVLAVLDNLDVG